jgi:hypothetical protein
VKRLRVIVALGISLVGILSGCAKADPYAGLSGEVDWESIEMMQETFNKKDTFTKFYVTLRNSGKEPIYLDAKFWFEIVTVEDQENQRQGWPGLETTLIEAEEISFLSLNSWESVSGVFEVMEPYTESTFLVAVQLPVNTFLYSLQLYDSQQTSKRLDILNLFKFCPDPSGATAISLGLMMGQKCDNGKVVSFADN